MNDEKQANESLKEHYYMSFTDSLSNAKEMIIKARRDGFDTLASEMEKELQGISKTA